MSETKAQRNYKDTVFRMLFKDEGNLLSLCNALNGTEYTDASGLEVTTLENAVYMNYKYDVSFVFDFELMLYDNTDNDHRHNQHKRRVSQWRHSCDLLSAHHALLCSVVKLLRLDTCLRFSE